MGSRSYKLDKKSAGKFFDALEFELGYTPDTDFIDRGGSVELVGDKVMKDPDVQYLLTHYKESAMSSKSLIDLVLEGTSATDLVSTLIDEKANPVYGKIAVVWVGDNSQQLKTGDPCWISDPDYESKSGSKKVWVMDDPKLDSGFFASRSDVSDGDDAFVTAAMHNNKLLVNRISQLR